jgi:hypothetical protein
LFIVKKTQMKRILLALLLIIAGFHFNLKAQVLNPGESMMDIKSFEEISNDITAINPETKETDCTNGPGNAAIVKYRL